MNDQQLLRYSRQIMLPEVEIDGQQKLLAAKVLIIGMGGLGSPAALYLAAAGVGTLVITDFDSVDLSNLQRQIIHSQADIGRLKVESARDKIHALNPDCIVRALPEKLTEEALSQEIAQADLVLDCSDRFSTRFAVNQYAVQHKVPLVSGAAIQFSGQLAVFDNRLDSSPCYRCLYEESDDEALRCAENGVISPLVGIIGTMQALEAVKLLSGAGQPATGRLMLFDALTSQWRSMKLNQDPECPVCKKHQPND
ncbi:adenylyltransferase and sulfurtransferase [Oceanospirillum multiglobuliferum]|uniref:Molybdopterin-synthase adenylyltransferase n=1 Tax=Oceanospirillum multiglobuliferum TaxID=64969 RepID=A0A1T4LCI0_9GAMM|nr:molybdopterin-synthase adenylyltransferase MoeB [Oceanospirillum multiglobuliferum]OPX56712.1 molybdopterin-synthase adenylyltransferase MoeB [Oceanospirillum multiglobuliferum]SJZ52361.1 adenylyltransferase and sulfurtransferase [Oceanospirillum multiglobuliferum]